MDTSKKLTQMSKLIPFGIAVYIKLSAGSFKQGYKWINIYTIYELTTNNVRQLNSLEYLKWDNILCTNFSMLYNAICSGLYDFYYDKPYLVRSCTAKSA